MHILENFHGCISIQMNYYYSLSYASLVLPYFLHLRDALVIFCSKVGEENALVQIGKLKQTDLSIYVALILHTSFNT